MSTDKTNPTPISKRSNLFLSWEIMLFYCLIAAAVVVLLQRPSGSISGTIALETDKFGLHSYDIRGNKVFAVATGPRDGITIARGVWVKEDGRFKIEQLPVGEYELKVRAPGYETEYINGIVVKEGQESALPDPVQMNVLEPSVSVASNVRVFTTQENPTFWIRATGAVESTVKLYRKPFLQTAFSEAFKKLDLHVSSDLSLYSSYNSKVVSPFAETEKPFRTLTRALRPNYEDSARADFKLDKDLPPGDYIVVAECKDVTGEKKSAAVWWFTVSDIGLVAKHSPEGTLVRVIDLNTLTGISGVNVSAVPKESAPTTVLAKATTGADGIAFIKSADSAHYEATLIAERQGHTAYASGGYWYGGGDDNITTYFYTDRPVYRLGQTVCFKGIARKLEASGFNNIGASESIDCVIEDPTNVELYRGTLKTSRFGTFNGMFEIPQEGKTGAYSVKLTYASTGKTAYEYFEVDQYRKPEYKIEIKPNVPRITAGAKVTATLTATYFFGGPVANARVKYWVYASPDYSVRYRLQPRPDYYSYFDGWSYGEDNYYDYGGSFVQEGVAQTNENGEAEITFDTKKIEVNTNSSNYWYEYNDRKYKIEAEVTDISRLTVTGSGNVAVTAGDFALFVDTDNYVIRSGEGVSANIEARSYEGKPIPNQKIRVKVSRWPWNPVTRSSDREVVETEGDVVTDENGKVKFSSVVGKQWPTDTFYISASTKDSRGNTIVDATSVWVASSNYPFYAREASKESFKITMNKKIFKPGETARVMISGPFDGKEGYDALVTVEGTTIYSHRIVPLKASANLVELPIDKAYAPNVYVAVAMVAKKKQFYNSSQMIMVSPQDHFLKIAVETDKQKYKAGDTARYTIKATYEDGRPAPNTELSLGVVDESIYSIRAEQAGDIRKTFYSQRSNKVNTFCSFPETYSGGPDKTAMEPKLRKNFKDTAAWLPQLVTDANGVVTAQVKLPDNLTTWRATVRGVTMGCDVGATTQTVMVTQDIIARLALPRFYTEGDSGEISAVVHNYSDLNQNIQLELTVSDQFRTSVALAQNLSIDKEKAARFTWPVSIAKPGVGVIRLKAKGQTGGDYLERQLPVNALGIPLFNADSGVLTDAVPTVQVSHAEVGSVYSPKMTVNLAGSVIGQVQGTFDSLIDYPYGCTEQTMSRFMPSIIAMQLKNKLNVPLLESSVQRFEKVRRMGIAKLSEHQHSDGGWGWWKDDRSDPYMTSLVLEGLYLLKDAGYQVDDNMMARGLKWLTDNSPALEKALSDPKLVQDWNAETRRCDMARLAYTMSVYKAKPNPQVIAYIKKQIPTFTPEPLAYTALALKNIGDEAGARLAGTRLLALANKTESTVDWEHTDAMMKRLKLVGVTDYSYRYTGEETTALAFRAMLAVDPDKSELLEQIKHWILLHRDRNGWCNTKTTSEVLLALLNDAIASASTTGDTVSAKVLMDNVLAAEMSFTGGERFSKERSFVLPAFAPATNSVKIEKVGQGKLYYNTLLSYTKALKPGESVPVKNSPAGLTMKRTFYRLETQPAGTDGVLKVVSKPFNGGTIKAGETILMKVEVESPMSLPYVIVECPLPSGAEVVRSAGAAGAVDDDGSAESIAGDWGRHWWSHQDVLDDKIVFFGTTVPQGKKQFHTLLRMELPGKVNVNPVTLEGMYTKLIRGYTQSEELSIK